MQQFLRDPPATVLFLAPDDDEADAGRARGVGPCAADQVARPWTAATFPDASVETSVIFTDESGRMGSAIRVSASRPCTTGPPGATKIASSV
jgi:hypothetical protein